MTKDLHRVMSLDRHRRIGNQETKDHSNEALEDVLHILFELDNVEACGPLVSSD